MPKDNLFRFAIQHKKILGFGFLLKFFSGFGQTFLIALYVPFLMKEFLLTNTEFGGFYSLATVISSILLSYIGKIIDYADLKRYTIASIFVFITSLVVLGSAGHIVVLILGMVGLRFAGQGLMSHISSTTISKIFTSTRGRALSVISIGYALGEGLFPGVVGVVLSHYGWRVGFFLSAGMVFMVLFPLVIYLLNDEERNKVHILKKTDTKLKRTFLFKQGKFYVIATNAAVMPFLLTGFFFYQSQLAKEKSWSLEWIGISFIAFASGRMLFSIISGPWIDRWTAKNLFPFYLFPFLVGLIVLVFFSHPYIAFVYMITAGISVGINTNIVTAVLAEVYGSEYLGGIRSIFSMLSVVSTALSPLLFGYLLDTGFDFTDIVRWAIGFILLVTTASFFWVKFDSQKKKNIE